MAQITLRDYLQETEDAISANRIEDALANCQYILAYFPESLEAQRLLGEIYLAQGRLEEAQQAFDWILTNDPENVIAYCNRALVSERMGDNDTALDCYQQAYELSRGNSQIREQFNQLSAKVGQQGFMFSRAGLARLYMRGDLLSQAIQEWECVLAATPDRLDARIGLLETYWQAAHYEQVTQLATHILQSIPGCLKAQLLLAHVTAARDLQQAQEQLQQAAVIDPDQVMAHDLFADLLVKQPGDAFLNLLQKPPVTLNRVDAAESAAKLVTAAVQSSSNSTANVPTASMDVLAQWGSSTKWDNDTTLVKPRSANISQQDISASAAWAAITPAATDAASMVDTPRVPDMTNFVTPSSGNTTYDKPWQVGEQIAQPATPAMEPPKEPWQLLQEALNHIDPESTQSPAQSDQQEWDHPGAFKDASLAGVNTWESTPASEAQPADAWASPAKEGELPAPPAWLNMLTQTERRQLSDEMPSVIPEEQLSSPPAAPPAMQDSRSMTGTSSDRWEPLSPPAAQPMIQEFKSPMAAAPVPWQQDTPESPNTPEQDEESFFGPEWLKSLGATTLDNESSDASIHPDVPTAQASANVETQSSNDTWISQVADAQPAKVEQSAYDTWTPQTADAQPAKVEQPAYDAWTPQTADAQPAKVEQSAYDAWTPQTADAQPAKVEQSAYDAWTPQTADAQPAKVEQSAYDAWTPQTADAQPAKVEQSAYDAWTPQTADAQPAKVEQSAYDAWTPQTADAQPAKVEQSAYDAWTPQTADAQPAYDTWISQITEPDPAEKAEQNLVTTLEELEKNLRSQGFIPLEPNSLSTIAQDQQTNTQNLYPTQESTQLPVQATPSTFQEPSLSSALAELGQFTQQPPASGSSSDITTRPYSEAPMSEPAWMAALRATPTPALEHTKDTNQAIPEQQEAPPIQEYKSSSAARERRSASQELPDVSHTQRETPTGPDLELPPSSMSVMHQPPKIETTKVTAVRGNAGHDSELEMTMKRPAVRLQPVQQRPATFRDQLNTPKAHSTERGSQ